MRQAFRSQCSFGGFPGKGRFVFSAVEADFIEKVEDKHDQTAGKRTGVYFNF